MTACFVMNKALHAAHLEHFEPSASWGLNTPLISHSFPLFFFLFSLQFVGDPPSIRFIHRVDRHKLFEISEIQSIVRILIRFIFESESSLSQSITDSMTDFMTDVQNTVSFSKNINMIDDVDQNDFIEQMKLKLTIIEIEKKRAHLRHKLIQMKTKKRLIFL